MKAIIFLIFLVCSVPSLEAIKCYKCPNLQNPSPDSCDNVDDKFVVDCEPNSSCAVVRTESQGKTITVYICVPKHEDGCQKEGPNETCFCNTDKCKEPKSNSNSSNAVTASIVSLFALISAIAYHNC